MPNHVRNALSVVGPARDIATFVVRSQVPPPPTGDAPGSVNYTAEAPPASVPFDLHGVVPLPALYSQVPYSNGGKGPSGYAMEVDTWGVKWGAYSITPEKDIQITEHRATYRFTTAWEPPTRYYATASLAFPGCIFYVSWGGEGPCVGRAVYQGGRERRVEEHEAIACPTAPDDAEDEAAAEAYNEQATTYETQYLSTHDAWVESMIHATERATR